MRAIATTFGFVLWLASGCGHPALRNPSGSAENWPDAAPGGIGRSNYSPDELTPPLALSWEYDAGAGFGPRAAFLTGDVLFVGTLTGGVHSVDVATGKETGSFDFGSSVIGTPASDGRRLIVTLANDEEGLVAYDLAEGKIAWKLVTGDVESSPLLLGDRVIVTTLHHGTWCVDKSTGAVAWKFETSGRGRLPMLHSSPASDGSTVVFGCDDGTLYAVEAGDGKLRWKANAGESILATPTIANGKVFVGSLDHTMYAFNIVDGAPVWKTRLDAPLFASQAVDETRVYVGTAGRSFFALDKSNGAVVWQFSTDGAISSPPMVTRDFVYFGSIDRNLYALRCASGELVWKFEAPGRIKSMPVVSGNRLYLPVEDTAVLSFVSGVVK